MVYAAIGICIFSTIASIKIDKKILNPMSLFMSVWVVMLYMNSLRLFTLFETDNEYYEMITLGLVMFLLGYIIAPLVKKVKIFKIQLHNQNTTRIYILCGIVLLLLLLKFVQNISIISSLGLAGIRKALQTGELSNYDDDSILISFIWQIVLLPARMALSVVVAENFFSGKKNKVLLMMYAIVVFMSVLIDGGRSVILNFIIHIALAFYYEYAKKKTIGKGAFTNRRVVIIKKKSIKVFIGVLMVVTVFLIAFVVATMGRSGEYAIRHLYYYGSIPPVMFNIWSDVVNEREIVGFGLASLNGFLSPILYALKILLGTDGLPFYWGKVVEMIYETDSVWVRTSFLSHSNAYVSLFWFFYLDGRILGVIVGMFLYGFFSNRIFREYDKNRCQYSLCELLLWIQGLLFSGVRFQFAVMPYALAFVYLRLLFEDKEKELM